MSSPPRHVRDRHRGQRGSILSAVLIIVAFLSILVGAVMTELTGSFLTSGTLVTRMQREATVTSAVELGIHQLQGSTPSPVCVRDARGPWFVTLNNSPAVVTQTCTAIVPDLATGLASGAFNVDGVHNTTAGRDQYIVGDSSGQLRAYAFGQAAQSWSVALGGAVTAPPLPFVDDDGQPELLVPAAISGSGCGGQCATLMHYSNSVPSAHCSMPATSWVTATPAIEASPFGARNFPDYAFFYGSGANGNLYVYDAAADHSCPQVAAASMDGGAIGTPLVFSGEVNVNGNSSSVSDEIFLLVSGGGGTSLEDWRFTVAVDKQGSTTISLDKIASLQLTNQVGASAVGYAVSAPVPAVGGSITLAITGSTGRVALARIALSSQVVYSTSLVGSAAIPGGVSRAPYWCHCPGQDLIGVGSTNGNLYLLSTGLADLWTYSGQADGSPAINSTPGADANGEWYFGANDGYVYDVEVPASGQQMFKAARFGPGGAIVSSPVIGGAADACGSGACLYFASTTAGSYFVRLGDTRIIDLRACVSLAAGSTDCYANPRLWARVEVGSPAVVGGSGVYVQGWSYYSP
jgi:hypothetical protein